MKLVKIILRREIAMDLRDTLFRMGCHGITTKKSRGYGEHRKIVRFINQGEPYEAIRNYNKRIELELVVSEDKIKSVLQAIRENAKTDQEGDGRVYVMPIEDAFHIHCGGKHTGSYGEEDGTNGK